MKVNKLLSLILLGFTAVSASSCSPFIFIDGQGGGHGEDEVEFENCRNSIFFALYNYYGIHDQHFTNKWEGMNAALAKHGVTVTGWEAEKDAKKFKIKYEDDCDLPADREIYMVNNQTWDTGLQYTKPLAKRKPMAVISTCNGVEFASNPIKSSGLGTQNATIGSFSDNYHEAFKDGSLSYLVSKYTAHIAPIFAACVDAVVNDKAMRDSKDEALQLSVTNWAITSIEEYDEMSKYDRYVMDKEAGIHPTILKQNLDPFFTPGNELYGPDKLTEFVKNSSFEQIKELYLSNDDKVDVKRDGEPIKAGLLVPGSVNDTVQGYIDYMRDYLADVYNVKMMTNEAISSQNTQSIATQTLIDNGAQFIISLQDDTDRNAAIKIADQAGVYFGIAGTCQNPTDYSVTKDFKHFVGSIGTSIQEEFRAAEEMTEYYLQKMIARGVVDEDKK